MKEPTEFDYAYLAGLIDGDGCVTIGRHPPRKGYPNAKPTYGVQLIVTSKTRALVDWPKAKFGSGAVFEAKAGYCYWQVTGEAAVNILVRCLPYLVEKGAQVKVVMQLQELKREKLPIPKQHALYEQLKAMHL